MNLGHILFSFSGRINRAKWWLSILIMVIVSLVFLALTLGIPETVAGILAFVLWIVGLWVTLAAGAKRLHDLNKSGAWLVLFIGGPMLISLIFITYLVMAVGLELLASEGLGPDMLMRVGVAGLLFLVLQLVLFIWALIWLGCLRGTVGPNQYGPDPLEGRI